MLYCVTLTRTIPVYDRDNKTADKPDKVRYWSQHIQCKDLREAEDIASRLSFVSSELNTTVSVRVYNGERFIILPLDCIMQIATEYQEDTRSLPKPKAKSA